MWCTGTVWFNKPAIWFPVSFHWDMLFSSSSSCFGDFLLRWVQNNIRRTNSTQERWNQYCPPHPTSARKQTKTAWWLIALFLNFKCCSFNNMAKTGLNEPWLSLTVCYRGKCSGVVAALTVPLFGACSAGLHLVHLSADRTWSGLSLSSRKKSHSLASLSWGAQLLLFWLFFHYFRMKNKMQSKQSCFWSDRSDIRFHYCWFIFLSVLYST